MSFSFETKTIPTTKIWLNEGQIDGLPANPRFIRDDKFIKLVQSIKDDPELLELRECLVVPYAGEYVVIAGNMRLKASIDAGLKEVRCKVIPENTPIEKIKAFVIKDNISYGSTDWDMIQEDWNKDQLEEWGMDIMDFGAEEEESEEKTENPKQIRLIIECENYVVFDNIRNEVAEILKGYEGASIKD